MHNIYSRAQHICLTHLASETYMLCMSETCTTYIVARWVRHIGCACATCIYRLLCASLLCACYVALYPSLDEWDMRNIYTPTSLDDWYMHNIYIFVWVSCRPKTRQNRRLQYTYICIHRYTCTWHINMWAIHMHMTHEQTCELWIHMYVGDVHVYIHIHTHDIHIHTHDIYIHAHAHHT